ncbi:cupredoxin domain-containing protein [Ochrobactrum teleogrylli]|uniref:cupredoxin domain-containing protein n=1 Tax=Ochrobactrum teleogrylli TaxID=2479765 RepID=UPI00384D0E0C
MTQLQFDRRTFLLSTFALLIAGRSAESHNGVVHVTIKNLAFESSIVKVKAGWTVEWTNKDPMAHTATVQGGWEVIIPPGKRASRVITDKANIDYYCRFHPNMKGRIEVV